MQSLIGIALSLLPPLIELVAEDKSNALAVQASNLVASTIGADEETIVCQRLLDPTCARTVTVRLAELALTAQRSRSAIAEAADQLMREDIKSMQRQLAAWIAHSSIASREGPPPRGSIAAAQPATPVHSNFLPCLHEVLGLESIPMTRETPAAPPISALPEQSGPRFVRFRSAASLRRTCRG